MGRDLALADRLRRDPVLAPFVVEVAGWRDRGSASFAPRGFVWHHTAGPRRGAAPSLTICTYGREGLPGPLCNLFLARDCRIYVVAAGRANHAGTGGWKGLSGNSSVYGIEIENTGYNTGPLAEPWPPFLVDLAARIAAALPVDHEKCCHHKEWTSRKVDMHTLAGRDMRARVAQLRNGQQPAPPPAAPKPSTIIAQEADMFLAVDKVGFFAVIDGVPVDLETNLAGYGRILEGSPKVPAMTLAEKPGRKMLAELLRKHNALTA